MVELSSLRVDRRLNRRSVEVVHASPLMGKMLEPMSRPNVNDKIEYMQDRSLRRGEFVEVRSAEEILATLDERGMLEGLPFMPEMLRYCGRRLVVDQRTEKICDTTYPVASRRLPDTVLLGNLRCDGSAHDGCQSDCRLFWKEAWLRRSPPEAPPTPIKDDRALIALTEMLARNTRHPSGAADMYQCQETELHRAAYHVKTYDPRAYLRVYTSGNVGLVHFLKVVARAVIEEPARKLGLTPRPWVRGTGKGTARAAPLNLQPGDLVQVKSKEEIIATLDASGKNRGLLFDREMSANCGQTFRVRQRITRFIDDRAMGKMITMKSDCLTLEGSTCSGELSSIRWFCPRAIHGFWREIWLRPVGTEASVAPVGSRLSVARSDPDQVELEHHVGSGQIDDAPADDERAD